MILCEACGNQADAPEDSDFFCFLCLQASDMLPGEPEDNDYEFFPSEAEARFAWGIYCLSMYGKPRPFPGDRKVRPETGKGAIAI